MQNTGNSEKRAATRRKELSTPSSRFVLRPLQSFRHRIVCNTARRPRFYVDFLYMIGPVFSM